jgi:hypothetical protein
LQKENNAQKQTAIEQRALDIERIGLHLKLKPKQAFDFMPESVNVNRQFNGTGWFQNAPLIGGSLRVRPSCAVIMARIQTPCACTPHLQIP